MNKKILLDQIQQTLFAPPDKTEELTGKASEIKNRLQQAFTFWHQNPHYPDKHIVNYLINTFSISKTQAYRDLSAVKYLLGCVRTASKEWTRHMVIEMCRSAYIMAKIRKDPKAMALAADKIGKYSKLDKDEQEELPWDQLIPPNFEPVPDVQVLNIKPIKDIEAYRAKLRARTLAKYDPSFVEDAKVIGDED